MPTELQSAADVRRASPAPSSMRVAPLDERAANPLVGKPTVARESQEVATNYAENAVTPDGKLPPKMQAELTEKVETRVEAMVESGQSANATKAMEALKKSPQTMDALWVEAALDAKQVPQREREHYRREIENYRKKTGAVYGSAEMRNFIANLTRPGRNGSLHSKEFKLRRAAVRHYYVLNGMDLINDEIERRMTAADPPGAQKNEAQLTAQHARETRKQEEQERKAAEFRLRKRVERDRSLSLETLEQRRASSSCEENIQAQ
jgi:hypothetical protein